MLHNTFLSLELIKWALGVWGCHKGDYLPFSNLKGAEVQDHKELASICLMELDSDKLSSKLFIRSPKLACWMGLYQPVV